MQTLRYCVYNQNNECFLSLGATLGDHPFARIKEWFGFGRSRADEGSWVSVDQVKRSLSLLSSRDLVYLDASHRVIEVLEAHRMLRAVPQRPDATTLLVLPVHTICSSRTRPGNQLVICAAGEMEKRLRDLQDQSAAKTPGAQPVSEIDPAPSAPRPAQRSCFAVAYYSEGGTQAVHAIRDLSAKGLYLVTRDRWPIGAEIKMSLQHSGVLDGKNTPPMTVRMRVTRWGRDGVGLEFAGAAAEAAELSGHYVC